MTILTEIISSPLYLFLNEIMPEGFGKQVLNFAMAWTVLNFTVVRHFRKLEHKFDLMIMAVDSKVSDGSKHMVEMQMDLDKLRHIPLRVEILEEKLNKTQGG